MYDIDQLSQRIQGRLEDFAFKVLLPRFRSEIKKRGLILSAELLNSFDARFTQKTTNLSAQIVISFASQGRITDLKFVQYKKQPPIDKIKIFVLKKGLSSFPYIPGYEKSNSRKLTDDQSATRIAWGIAKSFKAKSKIIARHTWQWGYSKLLFQHIGTLKAKMAEEMADFLLGEIGEDMKDIFTESLGN